VLVHGLGLVELALALEVQRQVVQVVHHGVAHGHAAEAVEGHVQLALALQGQAHHAVGFGRLLVGLELARLGHRKRLVVSARWPMTSSVAGNTSLSHSDARDSRKNSAPAAPRTAPV
jgi:hypothetical protein